MILPRVESAAPAACHPGLGGVSGPQCGYPYSMDTSGLGFVLLVGCFVMLLLIVTGTLPD